MGLWMKPESALLRLVADEKAPVMARVRALEAVQHPPLILLRCLIVEPKTLRKKAVPSLITSLGHRVAGEAFECLPEI